jgi:hypothetical protein
MRIQGSVLGYENKFYLNKSKVEWVLQCILWVFRCNILEKEKQTVYIRKLNDIEKLPPCHM